MFPGLFFFKRLHVREAYIPDTRIPHTRKPERLLIRMIFTAVINHNWFPNRIIITSSYKLYVEWSASSMEWMWWKSAKRRSIRSPTSPKTLPRFLASFMSSSFLTSPLALSFSSYHVSCSRPTNPYHHHHHYGSVWITPASQASPTSDTSSRPQRSSCASSPILWLIGDVTHEQDTPHARSEKVDQYETRYIDSHKNQIIQNLCTCFAASLR